MVRRTLGPWWKEDSSLKLVMRALLQMGTKSVSEAKTGKPLEFQTCSLAIGIALEISRKRIW